MEVRENCAELSSNINYHILRKSSELCQSLLEGITRDIFLNDSKYLVVFLNQINGGGIGNVTGHKVTIDVSIVGCQQFLYIESIGPYVLHQVNAVISIDICDLLIEGQAQFLIDSHSWHPFPNMLK